VSDFELRSIERLDCRGWDRFLADFTEMIPNASLAAILLRRVGSAVRGASAQRVAAIRQRRDGSGAFRHQRCGAQNGG